MNKVLIAYVTKTGTTKETAEEISRTIKAEGFFPTVLPMAEVQEFTGYDYIILGAPINGMNWHPDATAFITRFQSELNLVPTSYFFVSYLLKTGCGFWKKVIRKSLSKQSVLVKPAAIGMFGGRVEKKFPVFARFMFGVSNNAPSDATDAEEVRKWARDWADSNPNVVMNRNS
jgi:menaquinone-dependent protoporphyrinogen oxidase